MTCPGLHCPGCSGGQSLGVLAAGVIGLVAVAKTVEWVADRIWWIGGFLAVCFVLSVAVCMWVGAWADRRDARFAERRRLQIAAQAAAGLPDPQQQAIAPVNIYLVNPTADQAAEIIRRALPGRPGAIIEGKPQQ